MSQKLSKNQSVLQRYRTGKENVYFYIIRDFMDLSEFDQEIFFQKMYAIYLTGVRGLSYEQFKGNLVFRRGKFKACIFIVEKQFNTEVGFAFSALDQLYYKENDFSKENCYICEFDLAIIIPSFFGGGLIFSLYSYAKTFFTTLYPNYNVISFQRISNPLMYELMCSLGSLVYPSPEQANSAELDKLLKKMMTLNDSEGGTEEKPFVIQRSFRLIGDDRETYLKKYQKSSEFFKYFVDQTRLEENTLLVCMSVEGLIEGNTLGLPAKTYLNDGEFEYEVRNFNPLINRFSKL